MTKALRPLSAKREGIEFKRATSEASKPNVSDLSVTLKYNPHHRTNLGPKEMPAVRVYRSDPEGVTLQIRREREYMSAWLSLQTHLRLLMLSAKPRRRAGHNESEGRSRRILKTQ
jgi:hypothetical protein